MNDSTSSNRSRKAQGPERPVYFNETDIDRVMAVVLALASEVASLRDRLDTHERIAATGPVPATEYVEAYLPDPATLAARDAWRDAYIRRLLRVFVDDIEALNRQPAAPP
jgi:hypothetical protein